MDLAAIFTTAFIIGFSGAMSPGPLLTVTVKESVQMGFIAGPLLMLGHAILELALVFALVGGLSSFLLHPTVAQVIAVLGGAFLVYMGYGIAGDVYKGRISLPMARKEIEPAEREGSMAIAGNISDNDCLNTTKRRVQVVATGMLVSLANPYWVIWWATVGLAYVTLALNSGFVGLTAFFTGHILADFTWYTLVAAAVTGGRKFFNDVVYKGVLLVCGVFMIGLGGYFVYSGLIA